MKIDKQRKTLWAVAALIALIYYGPSIIVAVYRVIHPRPIVKRPAPAQQIVPANPVGPAHSEPLLTDKTPEAPALPAGTEVYSVQPGAPSPAAPTPSSGVHYRPELARLIGFWRGRAALPGRGLCDMHFELREKAGTDKFTGYATLTCNSAGPLVAKPNAKTMTLNRNDPEAAILTGDQENGSLKFEVDQVVGTDSNGCAPTSFTMTPFGAGRVAAEWHEAACSGGHILLARAPR